MIWRRVRVRPSQRSCWAAVVWRKSSQARWAEAMTGLVQLGVGAGEHDEAQGLLEHLRALRPPPRQVPGRDVVVEVGGHVEEVRAGGVRDPGAPDGVERLLQG